MAEVESDEAASNEGGAERPTELKELEKRFLPRRTALLAGLTIALVLLGAYWKLSLENGATTEYPALVLADDSSGASSLDTAEAGGRRTYGVVGRPMMDTTDLHTTDLDITDLRSATQRSSLVAEAQVREAIRLWAKAWTAQNIDEYLAFYSSEFEPADGSNLADWQAQRRLRVSQPGYIKMTFEDLEMARLGDGRVLATFSQIYESDGLLQIVAKTLVLEAEDGGWRISSERNQ